MSTMSDTKRKRTRRSSTDEFKSGAVRLVLEEGKTVGAAARDLDLTESSLRNWVEQARADRTKGKTGLTTAEREELGAARCIWLPSWIVLAVHRGVGRQRRQ
jgi:transposase